MSTIQQQFKLNTSFQIIYSHKYKLYDFTILDLTTNKILYHYHIKSLKEINKLIQQYK
jgi:hypothetical protein